MQIHNFISFSMYNTTCKIKIYNIYIYIYIEIYLKICPSSSIPQSNDSFRSPTKFVCSFSLGLRVEVWKAKLRDPDKQQPRCDCWVVAGRSAQASGFWVGSAKYHRCLLKHRKGKGAWEWGWTCTRTARYSTTSKSSVREGKGYSPTQLIDRLCVLCRERSEERKSGHGGTSSSSGRRRSSCSGMALETAQCQKPYSIFRCDNW